MLGPESASLRGGHRIALRWLTGELQPREAGGEGDDSRCGG